MWRKHRDEDCYTHPAQEQSSDVMDQRQRPEADERRRKRQGQALRRVEEIPPDQHDENGRREEAATNWADLSRALLYIECAYAPSTADRASRATLVRRLVHTSVGGDPHRNVIAEDDRLDALSIIAA